MCSLYNRADIYLNGPCIRLIPRPFRVLWHGMKLVQVWKKYGLASIPLHHAYSKAQSAYGVGVLYNKQYWRIGTSRYSKAQSSTLNSQFKPCKFVEGQLTLSLAFSSVMLPCFIKAYAILPPNTIPFAMEPYRRKKAPMIKAKRHTHLLLLTCNLLLLIQRLLFPVLLQLR